MRLMLTCVDAMVLTDNHGKIIHCNRQWVELTGYYLSEVEGCDCSVLQGSMTDHAETRRCSELQKLCKPSTMNVVNYRKDGSMFVNQVTTVPIRGGYRTNGESRLSIIIVYYYLFIVYCYYAFFNPFSCLQIAFPGCFSFFFISTFLLLPYWCLSY